MKIDFTDVKSNFEAVPESFYDVRVTQVLHKTSKVGNPYIQWELEIADGELAGRMLWHNTTLTHDSLWNLKNVLRCLTREEIDGEFDFNASNYTGKMCTVFVEIEDYQGTKFNRVRRVHPVGYRPSGDDGSSSGRSLEEAGIF